MPAPGNHAPPLFNLVFELLKTRIQPLFDGLSDGCSFSERWHDSAPEDHSGKERAIHCDESFEDATKIQRDPAGRFRTTRGVSLVERRLPRWLGSPASVHAGMQSASSGAALAVGSEDRMPPMHAMDDRAP